MLTRRLVAFGMAAAVLAGACSATTVDTARTVPPTSTAAASENGTATPAPSSADAPTEAPTPTPTAAPTAMPPPPVADAPPAAPTHTQVVVKTSDPGNVGYDTRADITITFREANPDGVRVRVYGVIPCLPTTKVEGSPCLSKGTRLPASTRDFVAQAPAADGKVTWTWPAWEDIGGAVMANGSQAYESIVIATYNAAGHSRFVIVQTAIYCPGCTY